MTTPNNSQIQQHIAEARARWAEKSAALDEQAAAIVARDAAIAARLHDELLARMAAHLPAWMLEYIQPNPEMDYDTAVEFITLHLPGCAPLVLTYDTPGGTVTDYNVRRPVRVALDEEWWVRTTAESVIDLDQAVDLAASYGESYHEMAVEAARRNAEGERPEPTPAQPTPIEQALTLLAMLGRGERLMQHPTASVDRNHATDCALALGAVGIAIAYQLSRIADAAEQDANHLPY